MYTVCSSSTEAAHKVKHDKERREGFTEKNKSQKIKFVCVGAGNVLYEWKIACHRKGDRYPLSSFARTGLIAMIPDDANYQCTTGTTRVGEHGKTDDEI